MTLFGPTSGQVRGTCLKVAVVVLTEQLQETEDGQRDQHFGRQVRVGGRLLVAFQAALFGQHVFECGTDDAERHSRFIEACAVVKKRKETTRRKFWLRIDRRIRYLFEPHKSSVRWRLAHRQPADRCRRCF